uniref:Major capsid protein n=1 Tax=Dulem virus 268 TaxID=3145745 RepID=A0AAU8B6W9_9VIRU
MADRRSSRQTSQLVSATSPNTAGPINTQGYNHFDLSRRRLDTQRFDEVHPVLCEAIVEGSVAKLQSMHDLRTYSLASPMLSDLQMKRSSFAVPMSSIAPNGWEYLYKNPVRGQDIVYTDVLQCLDIPALYRGLDYMRVAIYKQAVNGTLTGAHFLHFINILQLLFTNASLPKLLGFTFPVNVYWYRDDSSSSNGLTKFDRAISAFYNQLYSSRYFTSVSWRDRDNVSHSLINSNTTSVGAVFNSFMDFNRYSTGVFTVTGTMSTYCPLIAQWFVENNLSMSYGSSTSPFYLNASPQDPLNLEPFLAYQQLCSQYYSNDHIDDIYNGRRYYQDLFSYVRTTIKDFTSWTADVDKPSFSDFFTINGVDVPYDPMAGALGGLLITSLFEAFSYYADGTTHVLSTVPIPIQELYNIIRSVFTIQASLRYGDYFTTARTQPLAVGDVSISGTVSNSVATVSAIDTNKSLWMQRFLNAVNRASQDIYAYIYEMAGVNVKRKLPEPYFLTSESYNIGKQQVSNTTSDNQGDQVTILKDQSSRYMFEIFFDEPSYLIIVDTFSVPSVYPFPTRELFFRSDRFDWYNSYMEHIGDQSLPLYALDSRQSAVLDPSVVFGYQTRYAQFKYGVSDAVGGFTFGNLPSWYPLYDPLESRNIVNSTSSVLSPYFLRNNNMEFDKLYSSLTYLSPGSRFHFVKSIYFKFDLNGRMQKFPSLL